MSDPAAARRGAGAPAPGLAARRAAARRGPARRTTRTSPTSRRRPRPDLQRDRPPRGGRRDARLDDYLPRFPHLADELRVQFEVDEALTSTTRRPRLAATVPAPPAGRRRRCACRRLDGCDLLDELGRGAMGVVYRGWQRAAQRPSPSSCSPATCRPAGSAPRPRRRPGLLHPNIVQVFEVKEHDGPHRPGAGVRRGRQPGPEARRQAAAAARRRPPGRDAGRGRWPTPTAAASSTATSSRPTSCSRRRRTRRSAQCVPKISDFGLAKLLEDEPAADAHQRHPRHAVATWPPSRPAATASGRPARGRLRAGGDPLRVPHRPAAVPGRDRARHAGAGAPTRSRCRRRGCSRACRATWRRSA